MRPDIPLKTSLEVARIKRAGKIVAAILETLRDILEQGITTNYINLQCEKLIKQFEATAALKGYKGFPASICTSVNNVAAHGIPSDYKLENGDIISLDLSVGFNGWHADSAATFIIGEGNSDAKRLINAAQLATWAGIEAAKAGGRLGDIGFAIEKTAALFGCRVLENYVGHGIGRNLHEEPMVLHMGEEETGLPIVPGMVFTVEPILSLGSTEIKVLKDGWSVVTLDSSRTAQFEHTLAIFGTRTEVLTQGTTKKSP